MQSAYGKTAFGSEALSGIYSIMSSKPDLLWDLNLQLIRYCTTLLGGQWEYTWSEHYALPGSNPVHDLRSGVPAGTTSLGQKLVPSYPQVQRLGKTFQANLSILDVLCHLGPDSKHYLAQYAAVLYP
jgi:hypothetical protein